MLHLATPAHCSTSAFIKNPPTTEYIVYAGEKSQIVASERSEQMNWFESQSVIPYL